MTETDFKVGDKVKFLKTNWNGKTGEVIALDGAVWPIRVREDDTGDSSVFHPSELKLVKPVPQFKAGDIVKSIGFQYMAFDGKTLIVEGPSESKNWDYKVRALGEDYQEGYEFRESELVPGEELAEWEIELLDSGRPSFKKAFVEQLEANAESEPEAVDGPAHYGGKDNPYEVIKVAEAWGFEKNAYLFNALKYLGRCEHKGSKVEDLKKLVSYVNREIALEEAK